MIKFLMGMLFGILLFAVFVYFGGGKTMKKLGEGLTDTGKRIEAMEGVMKETLEKEVDDTWKGMKKKILKQEKETQKKTQ